MAFAQVVFRNLDFEISKVLECTPLPYGFCTGIAAVPYWTCYRGYESSNYAGGTVLPYNSSTLDTRAVSLEGPDYWTPAIDGNFSILLQGGFHTLGGETNGAAIGQTARIRARTLTYLGSGDLRVTFKDQLLTFQHLGNSVFGADVSAYVGEIGELLFTAPWLTSGMLDSIRFLTTPLPRAPTLEQPQVHHDGVFEFQLQGQSGQSYTVQVSTNLVNWLTLTNVPGTTNAITIVDPSAATNGPTRFYRTASP
jgi:hypothetical protein